jgi:hypothetical protein
MATADFCLCRRNCDCRAFGMALWSIRHCHPPYPSQHVGSEWNWISVVVLRKGQPIARAFGGIFLLEVSPWVFSDSISFAIKTDSRSAAGLALIAYAALLYPLCGFISGHAYPATPVFGVAPCRTTIFTVGVLLMGNWRAMRWLLVIPVIWSAIGGSAAFLLRVPEDFGLIATLVVLIFFYFAHWRGLKVSRHLVST